MNSDKTPTHVIVQELKDKLREKDEQLNRMEIKMKQRQPQVNQITPVAQGIEIAKSEIEREQRKRKRDASLMPDSSNDRDPKKRVKIDWSRIRY